MLSGRQRKIESILGQPHIFFTPTSVNMADLTLDNSDGSPHSCVGTARQQQTLGPDLTAEPMGTPDMTLYTDGCYFKGPDGLVSAYAVVQDMTPEQDWRDSSKW